MFQHFRDNTSLTRFCAAANSTFVVLRSILQSFFELMSYFCKNSKCTNSCYFPAKNPVESLSTVCYFTTKFHPLLPKWRDLPDDCRKLLDMQRYISRETKILVTNSRYISRETKIQKEFFCNRCKAKSVGRSLD